MANTSRQITQRIRTAQSISKITRAMEMVSASKMRRAQDRALSARPYEIALRSALSMVAAQTDESLHPLLSKRTSGTPIALIVGTDRGLCGSLNQNLFREVVLWHASNPHGQAVAVGKKAAALCSFFGLELFAKFSDLPDAVTTADITPISTLLIDRFLGQEFRSVSVFYMDFVNTLTQKPLTLPLLPLTTLDNNDEATLATTSQNEYLFEPDPKMILDRLLPYYVENTIYQSFLEARASEHSARMVTMKNASQNANELVADLKLVFNKQRQASITNELLDITTAMASLS